MIKVVSWDGQNINDGTNYVAGIVSHTAWGLPPVQAKLAKRSKAWPVLATVERPGHTIVLAIKVIGANKTALREQLLRWFDPEDETPKRLVIADLDGSRQRYVLAYCAGITPYPRPEPGAVDAFQVALQVHGDIRWRAVSKTTDTWNITASGQTRSITNSGTDDAYPVLKIKPTATKSGGFAYRRWVAITWRSRNSASQYPVCITLDTQSLITAGKMQADGDDLRVIVDGTERARWLHDINTTSTKVWVNLDFQPTVPMTLRVAIPSTGSISSIEVNEDISALPTQGIVLIDSEAFVYTDKIPSERKLTGITRAAKGTSAAAHSVGTSVHWIQHDIWLLYGNSTVSAPMQDDRYRPCFELSSTNTSWTYYVFGDQDGLRAARWRPYGNITLSGSGGVYTATQRTLSSGEYTAAGAWLAQEHSNAYGWALSNPCGIVNVQWQEGLKRRAGDNFLVHCMNWPRGASWWNWHYNPTSPSQANTWESWSYSGPNFAVSDTIAIAAYFYPQDVEVGSAVVSLNSAETPTVSVMPELGNYNLDATITNQTTGEAIKVTAVLSLNQEVVVDCDKAIVTVAGERSLASLTLLGPSRQRWFRLVPGPNVLRFDDEGTTGVTLVTEFEARYY